MKRSRPALSGVAIVAAVLLGAPAALAQGAPSSPAAAAPVPAPPPAPEPASPAAAPATPVSGSTPAALGLAEVVRAAQDRFPLLLAADAEKEGAEADLLTAEGGFDPLWRTAGAVVATGQYPTQRVDTVVEQPTPLWGTSVFAGYRVGLGKFADYDGKLATNDFGELRAGVRVPVLRDGPIDRRRAAIQRAELGVEIAKLGKDQQKLEIGRIAAQRYWDWVAAGRRLATAEAWLALAEARNVDLRKRVTEGDLAEIEQLENERSVLARRALVVTATRQLEQAAIDLSLLYRKADGAPDVPARDRLPASLPEPPPAAPAGSVKETEKAALAARPEPKRAEAVKAQAAVEVDLARNQALPAIDLFVAGSADLGPGDEKRGIPVLEAGITIEIPLLGRPQRGRVQSSEAAARRADKLAQLARDRVGAEVRDAASAMEAARARAQVAAREIALAEGLEALEKQRFDLGDSTMLVVNLREQSTVEARLRRIDALADYQKAVAADRAARGAPAPAP